MKDLREYYAEPAFLEGFNRMFKGYPEFIRDVLNGMFIVDGAPVKRLLSNMLPNIKKLGVLNILSDVKGALSAL